MSAPITLGLKRKTSIMRLFYSYGKQVGFGWIDIQVNGRSLFILKRRSMQDERMKLAAMTF